MRAGPLLLALGLLQASPAPRPSPSPEPRPPNILVVLTDDQDARSLDVMPRVRGSLAEEGVSFASSFVPTSLCSPSRASLLTGRYAHNHGVRSNLAPRGGYGSFLAGGHESSNLATWLRAAGYRTALVGKYLNGYPDPEAPAHVPPGWDAWLAMFSPRGSDSYFDYSINENGRIVSYGRGSADYSTDVLAQRALELLRGPGFSDAPFFLLLAPAAPHAAATSAPRHEDLFVGLEMPRGPAFDERDVSDKPAYVREQARFGEREVEQIERRYRRRRRSLVAVDELVGRLLSALEADGRLERTLVVFTSDNGWFDGEHRFSRGKAAPYEESIRVPLVVRGPGVARGETRDELVANVDIAPTLLQLAGAAAPADLDGRSLVPLLRPGSSPATPWRHDVLLEYWAEDPGESVPSFAGLRSQGRTYVEYATGERELYELGADAFQLRNVYPRADPALRRRLAERLAALKACRGAACRD